MTTFKHQGDIPFHPFNGEIKGTKVKHNGSVVLALGEKTGHKHVTHNQHGTLTIAPGTYRVGQEREVDHFAQVTRKVID